MKPKLLAQRVAENVRAEMARKAVTQVVLAERINRTQGYLSRRVVGRIPFNVEELAEIAAALDCPFPALLDVRADRAVSA